MTDGDPRLAPLWLGCGLPVLAWAVQLNASYVLVAWVCDTGRVAVLHAVTLACLAVCLVGVGLLWRDRGRVEREAHRRRFIGAAGLGLGVLLAVAIVVQGLPAWFVPPCE